MAYRELGPASLAVVQAVDAALTSEDKHLLVACSGGADSLALAFAARYVAIRHYLEYAAIVIDHGLQDGSADVAVLVTQQLERLGYDDVTLSTVEVDRSAPAGRKPRLDRLATRRSTQRPERVPPRCWSATPSTIRPRPCCSAWPADRAAGRWPGCRPERDTCCDHSCSCAAKRHSKRVQSWDLTHGRTHTTQIVGLPGFGFARRVLPTLEAELGPGVAEALARTAELLRDDTELLDRLAAEAYRTAEGLGGTDTLDCAALESQPPALRRRILRLWLLAHGIGDLTLRHINAVESLVIGWHGQKSIQVPGATVTRNAGRLRVS